jgi:hypothetical protein
VYLLTEHEAYSAMTRFLEIFYGETRSDDVGGLLGEMEMLSDGSSRDPAAWSSWLDCVRDVIARRDESNRVGDGSS